MATNKEKLMHGVRLLALSFPFILTGPGIYFLAGVPAMQQGNYWWAIGSWAMMALAFYFFVKGLRTVLAALFND